MAKRNKQPKRTKPEAAPVPAPVPVPVPARSRYDKFKDFAEKFNNVYAKIFGALAVVVALMAMFINWGTSITFLSADENVIHVRVSNYRMKPLVLRDYRLKFPDLPIEGAPLLLIKADAQKTYVPAVKIDVKKPGADPGEVDVAFFVPGLRPICRPGLTEETLIQALSSGHAKVEIGVGANDVLSDTFSAFPLRDFIKKKILFEGDRSCT